MDCVANSEMNPHFFKAATDGIILPFNEVSENLHLLLTPIKNTILHIHITSLNYNKSSKFVEQILDLCPSLLFQVNDKGDTPLHAAAKFGRSDITRVLIERAYKAEEHGDIESGGRDVGSINKQKLMRMKNNDGNTALHEAARKGVIGVVQVLVREDPDFSISGNIFGETPLFIAAEREYVVVVTEILETCTSAANGGPDGVTALHAAVMKNNLDITRKLLEKRKSLTKETDQNGWTPLHYAAHYGCFSTAQKLLQTDNSVAYSTDNHRKMTALHMAASQGHLDIMTEIISHCSDCYEQVDHRGWNFLHFAMIGLSAANLKKLTSSNSLFKDIIRNLAHKKDDKGNTPLHVLAAYRANTFTNIVKDFQVHRLTFNKQQYDDIPHILLPSASGSPNLQQEIPEMPKVVNNGLFRGNIPSHGKLNIREHLKRYDKAREVNLLVATLIATVTFAAAFTMPGGYKSEPGPEQGTTVLTKDPAFQIFIILDSIAMVLSLVAVYLHLIISLGEPRYLHLLPYALYFIFFAIGAMAAAFVTGVHAVLKPSPWLATVVYCIGISFALLVILVRCKLRI